MSIEIKKITFAYPKGKDSLFTEYSEEFQFGEITALTGQNGCGKTTLAKLVLGILKPLQGSIFIDGMDISSLSLAETGRKIGYVMQDPAKQIFCTSVREEISYGLRNMKLEKSEIEERCQRYMEYFEILQYKDTFPFSLSHGEIQRVALASILAMRPDYLILDEPTASLDLYRKRQLCDYLQKINHEFGCGILLISHDRKFIESSANREVCLERRERK